MSKYLIIGLGNVGAEYNHTRHNIGFDVLDAFVLKNNGQYKLDRLAYMAEVKWKGRIFICIKPTTYMNLSGKAFKYWLDKEKIEKIIDLIIYSIKLKIPAEKILLKSKINKWVKAKTGN